MNTIAILATVAALNSMAAREPIVFYTTPPPAYKATPSQQPEHRCCCRCVTPTTVPRWVWDGTP